MNILILRIGRMGDMVMVLPAIHAIRKRYPEAKLYAVTSVDGLRLLPLVGIDPQSICVFRTQWFYRLCDTLKVKRWLKKHSFEHFFCFEAKQRSVAWLPNHAQVIAPQSRIQHYALRCLQLVLPQTTEKPPNQAYLPLLSTYRLACDEHLRSYGITPQTIVIGMHPSYSGFGKWGKQKENLHRLWSVDYFAKVALQLTHYAKHHHLDLKIVINLLPHEQHLGQVLIQKSHGTVIAVTVAPGFQSYLALIQRLNVLIVANTGVLHLAAALNTPVVALFSGYSPDDCGPYMSPQRCAILRAEDTDKAVPGINAISAEAVVEATLNFINKE